MEWQQKRPPASARLTGRVIVGELKATQLVNKAGLMDRRMSGMGILETATRVRSKLALLLAYHRDMGERPPIPMPCAECGETVPADGGHWLPSWRSVVCSDECSLHFQAAMH